MRVIHINNFDTQGGAARAAHRLHRGLQVTNVNSTMFVRRKLSNQDDVVQFSPSSSTLAQRVRRRLKAQTVNLMGELDAATRPSGYEAFNSGKTIYAGEVSAQLPECDLVNLHWVADFVDLHSFFDDLKVPAVWTLHDLNPMTGGCHYDAGCSRYHTRCHSCPQLSEVLPWDRARRVWTRKRELFERIDPTQLHFVAPSRWMAGEAKQSALLKRFPVHHIPNGLDLDTFCPRDPAPWRRLLGIPQEARVLLFVAQSSENRRKGFHLLSKALSKLATDTTTYLVSAGAGPPALDSALPHIHVGTIGNDDMLASLYSSADLFVTPSLQDNLPNTVLESMACGTPVVAFDVGGIPEMVIPGSTGVLVPSGDSNCLAKEIAHLLDNENMRRALSHGARQFVEENHGLDAQAACYTTLYSSILSL